MHCEKYKLASEINYCMEKKTKEYFEKRRPGENGEQICWWPFYANYPVNAEVCKTVSDLKFTSNVFFEAFQATLQQCRQECFYPLYRDESVNR